jgi:hypothetical protein
MHLIKFAPQPAQRAVAVTKPGSGYNAIGLNALCRCLFEDIDWSTDRAFEQTQARVAELEMGEMTLPAWYDVDDGFGLERLLKELYGEDHFRQGTCGYKPIHTQRLLNSILAAEGPARVWPTRSVGNEPVPGTSN